MGFGEGELNHKSNVSFIKVWNLFVEWVNYVSSWHWNLQNEITELPHREWWYSENILCLKPSQQLSVTVPFLQTR